MDRSLISGSGGASSAVNGSVRAYAMPRLTQRRNWASVLTASDSTAGSSPRSQSRGPHHASDALGLAQRGASRAVSARQRDLGGDPLTQLAGRDPSRPLLAPLVGGEHRGNPRAPLPPRSSAPPSRGSGRSAQLHPRPGRCQCPTCAAHSPAPRCEPTSDFVLRTPVRSYMNRLETPTDNLGAHDCPCGQAQRTAPAVVRTRWGSAA
jgi:hypothetical protein